MTSSAAQLLAVCASPSRVQAQGLEPCPFQVLCPLDIPGHSTASLSGLLHRQDSLLGCSCCWHHSPPCIMITHEFVHMRIAIANNKCRSCKFTTPQCTYGAHTKPSFCKLDATLSCQHVTTTQATQTCKPLPDLTKPTPPLCL